RLDEETAVAVPLAAENKLRAFLLADVAILEDLVHLLVGDLRPLLRLRVERVAELALLGLGRQTVDEFLLNLLLDKKARAGRAALAAVEIDGVKSAVYGLFHVGVGEDDVGALAAQFEGHALERVRSALLNDLGRVDVAGEGDLVDARM